ncbi:MAG: DUF2779 domain-containing protein [Bacteroidota bacterium]
MEKHVLSKSTFIRACQCLKSLYLYKNFYHQRDPLTAEQQAVFSRGSNVGMLARSLFPGGTDASPESPMRYAESVEHTRRLIGEGAEVIYEAAFQHDQVLAALDILVKRGGKWYAYEVKSATRISSTYLLDASLQFHVMSQAGIEPEDFFIVHINNQYVRKGKIDPHGLFSLVSVKKEAMQNREVVRSRIAEAKRVLAQKMIPDIGIGEHCFSPYPCDYMGTCWKDIPTDSVFEIAGMKKKEQFELYNAGILAIGDVPDEYALARSERMQVEGHKSKAPFIDKAAIREFLRGIYYPVYFLDFETFMPAVPIYDLSRPYQHIPFQYSLHYKAARDSEVRHSEFLGEQGQDPRHEFIKKLLMDTVGKGDILVYNAQFEKSVLHSLKNDFPEFGELIDERISRIKDLMVPFQQKHYYHPAMKGSHSIKNVLPALVPELKYEGMKIASGSMAMSAYEQLQTETDLFRILETREALLEYCRLDTLAMVRLFEALEKAAMD